MKKFIFPLFVLLCISILIGQKKATTEDGKIVILNENGTWQYQKKDIGNLTIGNSFGFWKVKYYVDDFGDPTHQGYIRTKLEGKFSNSATTNAKLNVKFLIESESVSIMLYEYADNHPINGKISTKEYDILIKHNGIKVNYGFSGRNWSDRIVLDKAKSLTLIKLFKKGGKFQFNIKEEGNYSQSTYRFTIDDASGFDNALKALYGDSEYMPPK